jgi:integrase
MKLKYLSSFKDRHGKTRWRFRRKGHVSCYIKSEFGTDEFMVEYTNALTNKISVGKSRIKARSIDDLIIRYLKSADFDCLATSTQTVYRRILDKFRTEYGELSVVKLERKHIRQIMDKKSESPSSANRLLSLLSIILDIALDLEWVEKNHARSIKKMKVKTIGFVSWTDEELKQFEDKYPSGSRERLAYSLYLYTGQRGSDVVKMSRADILEDTNQIRVTQQKTGKKLVIPLHPELRRELSYHKDKMVFVLTEYGKPFSTKGFQQWFSKKARQAGLENRTGHGMRKAISRKLAEAGCTTHEIAAITGHKTLSEIENYTKAVSQKKLANSAMKSLSLNDIV